MVLDTFRCQKCAGTRQRMRGHIVVSVLAIVVCGIALPQPDSPFRIESALGQTSNSTAPKSNQGSGESGTAKDNSVLPEKSPTGGSGQSSSGEAAQIERSATPLKLSKAQRQKIQSYFSSNKPQRLQSADFTLSIGAAVPRHVELHKLPTEIVAVIGGYRGDDYVVIRDQLVIVDSSARRVVAIVPGIG